jgi:hypothetical protein
VKNFFVCRLTVFLLAVFTASTGFAQTKIRISGTVEWDTMQMKAQVSLDLTSAGIRLPSGRNQGESLLGSGYLRLIQPGILNLQVDSSSTIGDLVNRGEFSLLQADALAQGAKSVPPALSPDFSELSASYTMQLSSVSSALIRHNSPSPVIRTLNPVSSAQYTGIIIIASENLPVHGKRSSTLPVPCLFPKIWDSDMNLIYEKNMLNTRSTAMVRYASLQSIFQNNPSGLTPELIAAVGERPLRIFARGVFGINPTDLIIDNSDALIIISSESNRRLLTEGKVAIILDDSVLRYEFSAE